MRLLSLLVATTYILACQSNEKKMQAKTFSNEIQKKGELVRVKANKDHYGVSQFIGKERVVVKLIEDKKEVNEDAFKASEIELAKKTSKKDVIRVKSIEDQWGEVHMESTSGAVYVTMRPAKQNERFRWYEQDEFEDTIAKTYNGYSVGKEVFVVKEKTRATITKLTQTHLYVKFTRKDGSNIEKWVPMEEVVK